MAAGSSVPNNDTDAVSSTSFFSCDYSPADYFPGVSHIYPGKTPAPSLIPSTSPSSHSTVKEKSNSPILSDEQQSLLQATVAKLKTVLQLSHFHGRKIGLSRPQVDRYIIDHVFDDLSDTLLKRASSHHRCGCDHYMIDYDIFVQPPLQDTEKALLASFGHCWELTANSCEAVDKATILEWFNKGLMAAGLPAWQLTSKRWQHVSSLLGLDNDKFWVMRSKRCSAVVWLNEQMRLV